MKRPLLLVAAIILVLAVLVVLPAAGASQARTGGPERTGVTLERPQVDGDQVAGKGTWPPPRIRRITQDGSVV